MTQFYSKAVAELLAASDAEYRARKLRGQWLVWCDLSGHEVEFDGATVAAACRAAFEALNAKD